MQQPHCGASRTMARVPCDEGRGVVTVVPLGVLCECYVRRMSRDEGTDEGTPEGAPVIADDGWFAEFTLTGERFDAQGMPAVSAVEVARYRDTLYEVARALWLDRNPDRSKVPDGFSEAFDLRLVKVDEGSARTRLQLNRSPRHASGDFDEWYSIFEESPGRVVEAIAEIVRSNDLRSIRAPRIRRSLKKLGDSLEPAESIVVGSHAAPERTAELTESVRRTLDTIDEMLVPQAIEASVEGVIVEFDSRGQTFHVRRTSDDRLVRCTFPSYIPGLASTVRRVMAEDGVTAPDVLVSGTAVVDSKSLFTVLWDVGSIELVRSYLEKHLTNKIASLRALPDGWQGPGSLPPNEGVLERLDRVIPMLGESDVHVALAPTGDGHAVLEWSRGRIEYTAEIEPDDRLFLVIDDSEAGELRETEVTFSTEVLYQFLTTGEWQ